MFRNLAFEQCLVFAVSKTTRIVALDSTTDCLCYVVTTCFWQGNNSHLTERQLYPGFERIKRLVDSRLTVQCSSQVLEEEYSPWAGSRLRCTRKRLNRENGERKKTKKNIGTIEPENYLWKNHHKKGQNCPLIVPKCGTFRVKKPNVWITIIN